MKASASLYIPNVGTVYANIERNDDVNNYIKNAAISLKLASTGESVTILFVKKGRVEVLDVKSIGWAAYYEIIAELDDKLD